MKRAYTLIFFLTSVMSAFSQSPGHDPLNWTEPIQVESNSVFMIRSNGGSIHKQGFSYNVGIREIEIQPDKMILETPVRVDGRSLEWPYYAIDATTGKFTPGIREHAVAAWVNEFQDIEIMIPDFDTTAAMWTNSVHTALNTDNDFKENRIYIRSGDFTGDGYDELVVSYIRADGSIQLSLLDIDSELQPIPYASFSDESLKHPRLEYDDWYDWDTDYTDYFIETGDLYGNGKDEIILQAIDEECVTILFTEYCDYYVYVKIYEVNGDVILPRARSTILEFTGPYYINFALTTGNFSNADKDEIAYSIDYMGDSGLINTLAILGVSSDLNQINKNKERSYLRRFYNLMRNDRSSLAHGLASGDLNNNGRDELIVNSINHSGEFKTQSNHTLELYVVSVADDTLSRREMTFRREGSTSKSYNHLKVMDINQDSRANIVIAFGDSLYVLSPNEDFDSLTIIGTSPYPHKPYEGYAIAMGNFQGYNFKLGEPIHSVLTDIVQPLVVLNSPPVHFDIFDGIKYDVNKCFSGIDCDFRATYFESVTEEEEIRTEIMSDWNFSAGFGLSGTVETAPMGVGGAVNFEAYFDFTYGKNFSKTDLKSHTITVSFEANAVANDRIFATTIDYDIWEYPVYYGDVEEPGRYLLVAVPIEVLGSWGAWTGTKSWRANSYIPNHEIGNILSYPATISDDPNLFGEIDFVSPRIQLDNSSGFTWNVDWDIFQQSTTEESVAIGFDTKIDAGIRLAEDYTGTEMSTHRSSVREGLNLRSQLGAIDQSIGDTKYEVMSYIYWAQNGALVLNYTVRPDIAPGGGTDTWWQEKYGYLPDPAFILPWRYDPEKGMAIGEEAKRHQTQDVFFDTRRPNPGDTISVSARVRNFSLVESPPVTVHFYVGDPDDGGTPITGTGGETFVMTQGIPARGFDEVTLQWKVPGNTPQFPRIYAVLDQDNTIDEVHTNNNKGFNILGQTGVPVSVEIIAENTVPESFELYQSYPNPFNPSTTIRYGLPDNSIVLLEVYNVLGQRVSVLVDETQHAGVHEVVFDASHLPSGMYIYRITAGAFMESKRMLLVK